MCIYTCISPWYSCTAGNIYQHSSYDNRENNRSRSITKLIFDLLVLGCSSLGDGSELIAPSRTTPEASQEHFIVGCGNVCLCIACLFLRVRLVSRASSYRLPEWTSSVASARFCFRLDLLWRPRALLSLSSVQFSVSLRALSCLVQSWPRLKVHLVVGHL